MANIICYFSKQKLDYTLEHVCALREHWDILTCFNIGLCYKNSYIVSWKHIPSWASIRARHPEWKDFNYVLYFMDFNYINEIYLPSSMNDLDIYNQEHFS